MQGSGKLHDVEVREGAPLLPGQEGQGHPARLREGPHRQEDRVTQVKPSPKSVSSNPLDSILLCFYIKETFSQDLQDM